MKKITELVDTKGVYKLYRDNVSKSHYFVVFGNRFCRDIYAEDIETAKAIFRFWG